MLTPDMGLTPDKWARYKSMRTLRAEHREAGGYFWERGDDSATFINVATGSDGWYFVTVEWTEWDPVRRYSVRKMFNNYRRTVRTIGTYKGYDTAAEALAAARRMARAERLDGATDYLWENI